MPKLSQPRRGSLQYWPRKRAKKFLPSANWKIIKKNSKKEDKGLLGFIGYKVGMKTAIVKDSTPNSLTKGKEIAIPITIIECPKMKIFACRFYKNDIPKKDFILSYDKELKKKLKLPKEKKEVKKIIEQLEKETEEYDDLTLIVYSVVKKTSLKKTPDIIEIGLNGNLKEKMEFLKKFVEKEISIEETFKKEELIDVRGLTKGKGFSGPVKRFGLSLKSHKSEKGRRRPGSLGPWHPARVTFRAPQAGQLGMFSRIIYNLNIVDLGKIEKNNINPKQGFKGYGNIKTDYIIVKGSVQGPRKRQLLLTESFRATKKQTKKKLELLKIG